MMVKINKSTKGLILFFRVILHAPIKQKMLWCVYVTGYFIAITCLLVLFMKDGLIVDIFYALDYNIKYIVDNLNFELHEECLADIKDLQNMYAEQGIIDLQYMPEIRDNLHTLSIYTIILNDAINELNFALQAVGIE